MNEPERLQLGKDRVGDLLRDYQASQETTLERSVTGPAFEAMERKRGLRAGQRLWLSSGALAAAAVAILAFGYFRSTSWKSVGSTLALRAEPTTFMKQLGDAPAGATPAGALPAERSAAERGQQLGPSERGPARDAGARGARPEKQLPLSGSCPSAGAAPVAERRACLVGEASLSGLSGEVALLELSRIDRNALGRPADALGWVELSLRRFPEGALRNEAELARLELLIQLGRGEEARALVRELLQSGRHDSRRGELLRLELQLGESPAK